MISKQDLYEKFTEVLSKQKEYHHVENDGSYLLIKEPCSVPIPTQPQRYKLKILFEWSNGKQDWINNFRFFQKAVRPQKPYKDMRNTWFCHRGFLGVWKAIEPYVKDEIMNPDVAEVEILGYSHGAAIAQLCYEYVKYHRPDIRKVVGIGFGAPRIVWGFLPLEVKNRFKGFIVVRNCRDLVTHVPPFFFGFHHIGIMYKIGRKSAGRVADHTPQEYKKNLLDDQTAENE